MNIIGFSTISQGRPVGEEDSQIKVNNPEIYPAVSHCNLTGMSLAIWGPHTLLLFSYTPYPLSKSA